MQVHLENNYVLSYQYMVRYLKLLKGAMSFWSIGGVLVSLLRLLSLQLDTAISL